MRIAWIGLLVAACGNKDQDTGAALDGDSGLEPSLEPALEPALEPDPGIRAGAPPGN